MSYFALISIESLYKITSKSEGSGFYREVSEEESDSLWARVIAVSDGVDAEARELITQLGEAGEIVLHIDKEVATLFNTQPEKN
jgi:hypothetical protein